jgi:Protein of unknown function (DUF2950)
MRAPARSSFTLGYREFVGSPPRGSPASRAATTGSAAPNGGPAARTGPSRRQRWRTRRSRSSAARRAHRPGRDGRRRGGRSRRATRWRNPIQMARRSPAPAMPPAATRRAPLARGHGRWRRPGRTRSRGHLARARDYRSTRALRASSCNIHRSGGPYPGSAARRLLDHSPIVQLVQYGSGGIMTFVVNEQGIVFQKNLGKATARIAEAMPPYDPDESWNPVEE